MDENIDLTILNEISKAAKMGMDSITFLSDKLENDEMKEVLAQQYTQYSNISENVDNEFQKYGEIPDDTPMKDKMMSYFGTQMNTMTDKSNSHIAEIMIQGLYMGIIECQKLWNHNPKAQPEVKNILKDFITFQEENIQKMRKFL